MDIKKEIFKKICLSTRYLRVLDFYSEDRLRNALTYALQTDNANEKVNRFLDYLKK